MKIDDKVMVTENVNGYYLLRCGVQITVAVPGMRRGVVREIPEATRGGESLFIGIGFPDQYKTIFVPKSSLKPVKEG